MGKDWKMLKEESALGSLAKVNANALSPMSNIISKEKICLPANWSKLHLDLDTACDIYDQLKTNAVKDRFTQVDPFKIYAILCVLYQSVRNIYSIDPKVIVIKKLSIKELTLIVNGGKYESAQAKDTKKQLLLISSLLRFEGKQILFYKKNLRDSPSIYIFPTFFDYAQNYLHCKKHDFLRLSKSCCSKLFSFNHQPKAFVCMLEQLFLNTKELLEEKSQGNAFDRSSISGNRIKRLFSPKAPHSVDEIIRTGHAYLKKEMGNEYSDLLKKFAAQMVDETDIASFTLVKNQNNEAYKNKCRKITESSKEQSKISETGSTVPTNDANYNIA